MLSYSESTALGYEPESRKGGPNRTLFEHREQTGERRCGRVLLTPRCRFESCRAYHFTCRCVGVRGGFERWRVRVCNGVCNGLGHNVAQSGTAWHNLAQLRGGEMAAETGWNLQGLLRFGVVGGWQPVVLAWGK